MESKHSSFLTLRSLLLLLVSSFVSTSAKVQHKVRCFDDVMLIDLVRTETMADIYLDQLKNYPDDECQAKNDGTHARIHLSLTDIHRCGVTRVSNKMTGAKVYYHKVVIEHSGAPPKKEYILVKCTVAAPSYNHTISKRNVLPAGFTEPEDLEVTTTLTGKAPEPMLSVGVRQGKEQVTGELNVNPGTPLTMEIYLDKASAPIYGVLVSYMQVTDTKQQEETIIFNGCSVDPYLFENFNTVNGDFLTAKFRAFKFPDSTYVQFRGTVNVCLDKCKGIECSNGQIGFGRRKRDLPSMPADPNKLFEVSLTTFIKINFIDSKTEELRSKEPNAAGNVFILKDHLYSKGDKIQEEEEIRLKTVERNDNDGTSGIKLWENSNNHREQLKYAVVLESTTNSAFTNSQFSLIVPFSCLLLALY